MVKTCDDRVTMGILETTTVSLRLPSWKVCCVMGSWLLDLKSVCSQQYHCLSEDASKYLHGDKKGSQTLQGTSGCWGSTWLYAWFKNT